jgi:hypothetical protein
MRVVCILVAMLLCVSCSDSSTGSGEPDIEYQVVGFDAGGLGDGATLDVPVADSALDTALNAPDVSAPGPEVVEDASPPPCTPSCSGLECGSDGCDGICGTCDSDDLCSEGGLCEPDPEAGCGGLELAENWVGTFEGVHQSEVLGGLIASNSGDTAGDLSFSLTCLNSKYIINGQMSGTASGKNPFELTLTGTYNPSTKELKGTVPTGHVVLADSAGLDIEFAGEMPGVLQADGTFDGTYDVVAVGATSLLGPLDPSQLSASSSGTWTAGPAP